MKRSERRNEAIFRHVDRPHFFPVGDGGWVCVDGSQYVLAPSWREAWALFVCRWSVPGALP